MTENDSGRRVPELPTEERRAGRSVLLAVLVALVVLAAACGSSSSGGAAATGPADATTGTVDEGTPVDGGSMVITLTWQRGRDAAHPAEQVFRREAVPADASFDDLPAPLELDADQESPSAVLARLRADER